MMRKKKYSQSVIDLIEVHVLAPLARQAGWCDDVVSITKEATAITKPVVVMFVRFLECCLRTEDADEAAWIWHVHFGQFIKNEHGKVFVSMEQDPMAS